MTNRRKHYTITFWKSENIKKEVIFDVFQRPVIPWSLECEINQGFSRKNAHEEFSKRFVIDGGNVDTQGYAITGLIFLCVFCARLDVLSAKGAAV